VREIALGGKRVIWQEGMGGNNLEMIVLTATASRPKKSWVSYAENGNRAAGIPGGRYTGHLLADGPLRVFASWVRCDPINYPEGDVGYAEPCEKGKPKLYAGALHRVVGGKDLVCGSSGGGVRSNCDKVVREGNDMLFPVWVDGGRILVRDSDSTLTLLRSTGATIRTFDVGKDYTTAVFQGKRLVVLRPAALDIYDSDTGERVRSFSLSTTPRKLVDVQSGIAVLISGGAIRLVQLDTGKGATVEPPGGGTIRAQLEPNGLFYSSASGLGFIPMPDVLRRFH
jgi:hypothetical protein